MSWSLVFKAIVQDHVQSANTHGQLPNARNADICTDLSQAASEHTTSPEGTPADRQRCSSATPQTSPITVQKYSTLREARCCLHGWLPHVLCARPNNSRTLAAVVTRQMR